MVAYLAADCLICSHGISHQCHESAALLSMTMPPSPSNENVWHRGERPQGGWELGSEDSRAASRLSRHLPCMALRVTCGNVDDNIDIRTAGAIIDGIVPWTELIPCLDPYDGEPSGEVCGV